MRDEKLHAVVESTFRSQNVQNTPCSDHFWKLRCRKSARRCGAKHISKSKCTKHTMLGPLLEVAMSKKCTPLWREARFEVKMYKAHRARTTFGSCDVENVQAVVVRSTFRSQTCKKLTGLEHFWTFRCRFVWQGQGILHVIKSEQNVKFCSSFIYNRHNTTLHDTTLRHYIPLHSNPLHCTALQPQLQLQLQLHYFTLHYTNYITLH